MHVMIHNITQGNCVSTVRACTALTSHWGLITMDIRADGQTTVRLSTCLGPSASDFVVHVRCHTRELNIFKL